MKNLFAFVVLLLLPFVSAVAGEPKPYEMPRTHVVPIKDTKSDRQYELYIKLPEEYSENTDATYPVIYTTDAVWHFDMLSGATEYLMPNVILVGISWQTDLDDDRAYVSRFRDYSFIKSDTAEVPTGEASGHLSFIRDDVLSYVKNNYRVDTDQRTYLGYSMGGAFGAYVLLAKPDTFNNYILGSPSFGRGNANYNILDELEAKTAAEQQELGVNVFVTIGELETSKTEVTEDLVSVLQRRSEAGLTLAGLEVIENSDHSTAFPETVIRGVRWLSQINSE